jgi:hypothetical protein
LSPFIAEVLNVWSFTFMSFLCLCGIVFEHRNSFDQSFPAFWEIFWLTCIDKFYLFWLMMWILRSVCHVCFPDCIQSMIKQWTTWPTSWRMKENCMRQSVFCGKLWSSGTFLSIVLWNSRKYWKILSVLIFYEYFFLSKSKPKVNNILFSCI